MLTIVFKIWLQKNVCFYVEYNIYYVYTNNAWTKHIAKVLKR